MNNPSEPIKGKDPLIITFSVTKRGNFGHKFNPQNLFLVNKFPSVLRKKSCNGS